MATKVKSNNLLNPSTKAQNDTNYRKYMKYKTRYHDLKNRIQYGGAIRKLDPGDVQRMLNLYKTYYDNMRKHSPSSYVKESHMFLFGDADDLNCTGALGNTIDQIERNPDMLKNLDVEYSMDEIERMYETYGVIILRDPTSYDNLLLGCGKKYIDDDNVYFREHIHDDYVSYNPNIMFNPTVVGAFEFDPGFSYYILERDHRFNTLSIEAITVETDMTNALRIVGIREFLKIFNNGFKIVGIKKDNSISMNYGRGLDAFIHSDLYWGSHNEFDYPESDEEKNKF